MTSPALFYSDVVMPLQVGKNPKSEYRNSCFEFAGCQELPSHRYSVLA
jgi:hypothetical protein